MNTTRDTPSSNGKSRTISSSVSAAPGASGRRNEARAMGLTSVYFQASSRFSSIGQPIDEQRDEAWKYTDVKPIARASFRLPDAPGAALTDEDIVRLLPFDEGVSRVVFIDGHYAPEVSRIGQPDHASVRRLKEAIQQDESFVHGH